MACSRSSVRRLVLLFAFMICATGLLFGQGAKMRLNDLNELEMQKGDQPSARDRWFHRGRTTPDGRPAAEILTRSYQKKMEDRAARIRRMADTNKTSSPDIGATVPVGNNTNRWAPMGPGPIMPDGFPVQDYGPLTGRATAVAVNPADPTGNTVAIGGAYGGVWLSKNAAASDPASVLWTPIADDQFSLAIGSLAWSPDGKTLLVGTGEGDSAWDSYYGDGFLMTSDLGVTWNRSNGAWVGNTYVSFKGMAIQRFAWSKNQPEVVAASVMMASRTGLTAVGLDQSTRAGVYYSTDSGRSWGLATVADNGVSLSSASSHSVVWNPVDHRFYAHYRFHGIYVSAPDDPSHFDRLATQPDDAGSGLNGTNATTKATNCPAVADMTTCPIFRAEIAANPARNELYAWWVALPGTHKGIWKSSDSGATWTKLDDSALTSCADPAYPNEAGCGAAQAFFNMTLLAVPNPDVPAQTDLYAGGVNIYKCTINPSATNGNENCGGTTDPFHFMNTTHVYGCSLGGDPAHVHPDNHDMSAVSGNSSIIFFANDGGITRTVNAAGISSSSCSAHNAYDNLNYNMGSMTQFVWGTPLPGDVHGMLAGAQDNGTSLVHSGLEQSNGQNWIQSQGGDGGYSDIDPNDPNTYYSSMTEISISKCTAGVGCRRDGWSDFIVSNVGSKKDISDESSFYAPFMIDPAAPNQLLVGSCRIWAGPTTRVSAATWGGAPISPMLNSTGTCGSKDAWIVGITAGGGLNSVKTASKVIWATFDDGSVWRTLDSASAAPSFGWLNVTPPATKNPGDYWIGPGFPVSSVALDPSDNTGKTAYITIQGFRVGHVLKTIDGGTTWTSLDNWNASLADMPVNNIAVDPDDPNVIYVAGDLGVFSRDQSTQCCWSEVGPDSFFGGFLPNVTVLRVAVQKVAGKKYLKAVTYGRGAWITEVGESGTPHLTVSPATSYDFGTVEVGSSASTVVTLSNTGTATLTLSSIYANAMVPGKAATDYSVNNISCGGRQFTLAPGATCQISVKFTPEEGGPRPGKLSIGYTGVELQLTGVGDGPILEVTPPGTVRVPIAKIGTVSEEAVVTIANKGTKPLVVGKITTDKIFSIASDHCSNTSVAAGTECTFGVTGTPTSSFEIGTLKIPTSLPKSPLTLDVVEWGSDYSLQSNPNYLQFSPALVGDTSAEQTVTVKSITSSETLIPAILLSGSNADSFHFTSDCPVAPAKIAPHATCSIRLSMKPTVTGWQSASLSLGPDASTIYLSGFGSSTSYTVSPSTLDFGNVVAGTETLPLDFTITNVGSAAMQFSAGVDWSARDKFVSVKSTCSGTLAAGASCTNSIYFRAPLALGSVEAMYWVTTNEFGPKNVTMKGTSVKGTLAAQADGTTISSYDVGKQRKGTTGSEKLLQWKNVGNAAVTISGVSISGVYAADFALSKNMCIGQLAPGATCEVGVTFSPSTGNYERVLLLVTSDASPSMMSVPVSGLGTFPAAYAPDQVSVGTVKVNTTFEYRNFYFSNVGNEMLRIDSITVTGDKFQLGQNLCGATLEYSCSIGIKFTPDAVGTFTGMITIVHELGTSTVQLTGTGALGVAKGPTDVINLYAVPIGVSTTSSFYIYNTGPVPLRVNGITSSSPEFTASLGNCGTDFANVCWPSIDFKPTASGTRTATLTISHDGSNGPITINVSGVGEDFTAPVATTTAATIAAGQSAQFTLTVSPSNSTSFGGPVSFQCSGTMPYGMTCAFNPVKMAVPASTTLSVSTLKGSSTRAGTQTAQNRVAFGLLAGLALLPGLALFVPKSRSQSLLMMSLIITVIVLSGMTLISCGGGGGGGGSYGGGGGGGGGIQGTPPGTYTITVSASSNNLIHNSQLTVTVQ